MDVYNALGSFLCIAALCLVSEPDLTISCLQIATQFYVLDSL
jgi:hypothetical protein